MPLGKRQMHITKKMLFPSPKLKTMKLRQSAALAQAQFVSASQFPVLGVRTAFSSLCAFAFANNIKIVRFKISFIKSLPNNRSRKLVVNVAEGFCCPG